VLVEYRVAAVSDVAQEVARLLVAESLYLARAREPVAPLKRVFETLEPLAQAHAAVGFEVRARHDDVARARVRVAVPALEGGRKLLMRPLGEQVPDGLD